MKPLKLSLTFSLVVLVTVSVASAAHFNYPGNYNPPENHYYPNSMQFTNSDSGSGNCNGACVNGNCQYSGDNCNTCQRNNYNVCQGGNCNNCQSGNCPPSTGGNCKTCPQNTNIPPNFCPNGNCPPSTGENDNPGPGTTTSQVTSTGTNGTTTYKLCSDGECHTGGDGSVITITNYDNAKDPTYDQLLTFLKEDKTDEHRYIMNQFICTEFAKSVHDNAEKNGIKCAFIGCDFKEGGIGHAFNMFNTTDRGIVYIDCTGTPQGSVYEDKILDCVVGKPLVAHYLFKDGSTGNPMGTVGKLYNYW